jgi:hypothetical protein
MENLWQILVNCAKSSSADIVCLIDALDECKGESAQQLLHMVEKSYCQHDMLLRPFKLKFLITSRPYDDLKWSFDRLLSITTYLHFDGDEKSGQIREEINLVIDVKVKHIAGPFSKQESRKTGKRERLRAPSEIEKVELGGALAPRMRREHLCTLRIRE